MPGARILLLVALAVALGAAGETTAATAGTSGVYGILVRGPIAPVCRQGVPCDAPAPGRVLGFTRGGKTTLTTARAGGALRVALPPGLYAVSVVPAPRIGGLEPRLIRVPVGGWARVRLTLDTGIR